uniref:Zinc-binding protein A33-like n=1 Tax=Leptobrachium leishanense TaxID=445787 RepID=A0A8C5Q845_9ANUR
MASAVPPENSLSEELTCSVCCDLLSDPVMLDCMHHFCRDCITSYWDISKTDPSCPHCRKRIPDKSVKTNQLLNKVTEVVKKCSTPEYHYTIEENGHDIRLKIAAEFQTLHEVLFKEEKQLLYSVEEEEEKALSRLKDIVNQLEKQIATLSGSISFIQKTLTKSGDAFIVEAEEMLKRPAVSLDCPVLDNCDQFYNQHKGPFQYMMWRRMLKSIHPAPDSMTYDASTAHPSLIFSNDRRSVTDGNRHPDLHAGDISRRFLQCINVLGSQMYCSGKHYWEVCVGNKTKWDLGVASDYVDRKGRVKLNPKNGYWTIRKLNKQYIAATVPWTALGVVTPLKRVGVYLDCGAEEVIFYDSESMCHLFTFTGVKSEGFYPFFSPGLNENQNSEPLKIHVVL